MSVIFLRFFAYLRMSFAVANSNQHTHNVHLPCVWRVARSKEERINEIA